MSQIETLTRYETLATKNEVDERIAIMAAGAVELWHNDGDNPLYVCLLRGAMPFAAKFTTAIALQSEVSGQNIHPDLDYMTISTYGNEREARTPRLVRDLSPDNNGEPRDLTDRHIVILDDVLDEGHTLTFAANLLLERHAGKISTAVLVQKDNVRENFPEADLYGFKSPGGLWLRGMGMDDAKTGVEAYRWTPHIEIELRDEN